MPAQKYEIFCPSKYLDEPFLKTDSGIVAVTAKEGMNFQPDTREVEYYLLQNMIPKINH